MQTPEAQAQAEAAREARISGLAAQASESEGSEALGGAGDINAEAALTVAEELSEARPAFRSSTGSADGDDDDDNAAFRRRQRHLAVDVDEAVVELLLARCVSESAALRSSLRRATAAWEGLGGTVPAEGGEDTRSALRSALAAAEASAAVLQESLHGLARRPAEEVGRSEEAAASPRTGTEDPASLHALSLQAPTSHPHAAPEGAALEGGAENVGGPEEQRERQSDEDDAGDPSHCTCGVERRGEFGTLGSLAGCFLALGSGLRLVGTASARR